MTTPHSTTSQPSIGLSDKARALVSGPGVLIEGDWVEGDGAGELVSLNPSTGEVVGVTRAASPEQVLKAIAAARRAFDDGPWRSATARQRSEVLHKFADLLDSHRDELVEIVVTEVGSPIALSRVMQVGMPVDNIRWAADMALTGPQGGYEQALPPHFGAPASSSLLLREPVGVVAGITGYNFPINSVAWKLGPGLAAGCSMIFKPSPRTPLATLAMIRLADAAGFPPGVINLVPGEGDVGALLSSHPDIDMTMFTGSLEVGRKVMVAAAHTTKRLVLELGGKSANILLPGADVAEATLPSILRWSRNAGQGCGATTRTLVHRSQLDEFLECAVSGVGSLQVGDPWDERTDVGPLIREEQREFVEGFVERAVSNGAAVVAGGGRPERDGFFVNPTLVAGLTNDDEICQEELFGPVGAVLAYDTVEEAIAIANDSKYGLHAAVFGPIVEALGVARRLRTGAVSINGGGFMRPDGPWGGLRSSGFGREMGEDGFREFFQVKHVQWPLR
jgi:aldehyde dehydrogenase (NAD+)